MELVGGEALLEEVCHYGQSLRTYSLAPPLSSSLPLIFPLPPYVKKNVISQLPSCVCCHAIHSLSLMDFVPLTL